MNEDAEREIERITDDVFSCLRVAGPHEVRQALAATMRWAYADVAKLCVASISDILLKVGEMNAGERRVMKALQAALKAAIEARAK